VGPREEIQVQVFNGGRWQGPAIERKIDSTSTFCQARLLLGGREGADRLGDLILVRERLLALDAIGLQVGDDPNELCVVNGVTQQS
jgi:hypothetical protein